MYPNHRELMAAQESPDDLDASIIFLQSSYSDFKKYVLDKAKAHKERTGKDLVLELIFLLDDPDFGGTRDAKITRLRQLKAMREDRTLKQVITKITVKGKEGDQMIEPNVFSSDVRYEVIHS